MFSQETCRDGGWTYIDTKKEMICWGTSGCTDVDSTVRWGKTRLWISGRDYVALHVPQSAYGLGHPHSLLGLRTRTGGTRGVGHVHAQRVELSLIWIAVA